MVEDDADARELLGMSLSMKGADVREVDSGEAALDLVASWRPEVILMDLSLPGVDGFDAFTAIRARHDCAGCVGIALSGRGREMDRKRSLAAGFTKHLVKPAAMSDIVSAIQVSAPSSDPSDRHVRTILENLNTSSKCQFTSVLRFSDKGTLVSMWTYDRRSPSIDSFPLDLPVEASYCVLVRASGTTTVIEDAGRAPRVAQHPKRAELAAYLGVPIFRADGRMFGTLCSFDTAPKSFTSEDRAAHEAAARELAEHLDKP